MSNKSLEKTFQILAVLLVGVTAFFLWQENFDGAFVSAALGCVSFFLSFRFQVKERLDTREEKRLQMEAARENYKGGLFAEVDNERIDFDESEIDNQREKLPIER